MKEITIAVGSKENLSEDIQAVAKQLAAEPKIIIAAGKEKDMRNIVIDHARTLRACWAFTRLLSIPLPVSLTN